MPWDSTLEKKDKKLGYELMNGQKINNWVFLNGDAVFWGS